jgi:hypothetical protein
MKTTKHLCFAIALMICFSLKSFSQSVGISSVAIVPDASSLLEVRSANQGILVPRIALTGVNDAATIPSPANSLLVYCTGTGGLTPAGYYYNSGTTVAPVWKRFATGSGDAWQLLGNAGTVDGVNFIGTTDNVPFSIWVNNQRSGRIDHILGNTFFGYRAGLATTVASLSTFFGFEAGLNSNGVGAAGGNNVFVGYQAGRTNTNGFNNVFIGYLAGIANTSGYSNTFVGFGAGSTVTSGFGNSLFASSNNGGGGGDIITGSNNSRFGYGTNWASGDVTGSTYFGYGAGQYIRAGNYNTCLGPLTGPTNTTSLGNNNTFVGYSANCGTNILTNATALGYNATVTSSNTVILGGNGANAVNVGIGLTAPNATSQLHIYKAGALAELLLQSNGHDNAFAGGRILFNNDVFGNAQGNITFVNDAFGSAVMNAGITYFPNAISINGDGPWANRYSNLAVGTTLFVSDVENGTVIKKVGIGTTTPQNSLDVSNANGRGVAIGSYAGVNAASSGGLIVSGSVGIGTPTPAALFHIDGGVGNTVMRLSKNTGAGLGVIGDIEFNNLNMFGIVNAKIESTNGGLDIREGQLHFFTSNNAAVLTDRMMINENGNVGIGTIWPGAALEVNGQVKITGGTPGAGRVLTSDGVGLASWQPAGGTSLWTQSGNYIYPNANANVQIDFNGAHTYGIYVNKTAPASLPANYFYDGGNNTGTGYSTNLTATLMAYRYWGSTYSAAIQGWDYGDYARTAGVLGYINTTGGWGALGYKNSASTDYGCYYTSVATGAGFLPSGVQSSIGSGGYGGIMGGWVRGEVLGFTSCGELYAAYNIGNVYTSGHQAEIVTVGDKRVAAYSLTSTDIKIYNDGKAILTNGKARVTFDASFAEMIGNNTPIVTISPMGQCNGLFIKNVDSGGFDVEELNGGSSNVEFSFIVIGKRIDADVNSELPEALSDRDFDNKMKGVMFNENNKDGSATPIWWDGTKIRFDKLPESKMVKKESEK